MNIFALRLRPGQDLKESLLKFIKSKSLKAGFIITGVGSLQKACLRLAGAKSTLTLEKDLEIVSLEGTLSQDGMHIHITVTDDKGKTIGGHLKNGCIVKTTAEIIVGQPINLIFKRNLDPKTGYKELKIEPIKEENL